METKFYDSIPENFCDFAYDALGIDGSKAHIGIDKEDIVSIIAGAKNALLVEAGACGPDRLKNVLLDISQKAPQLSKAKNVLIYIVYDNVDPLMMVETEQITDFISKFNANINIIWGIGTATLPIPTTASIRILASDIE